MRIINIAVGIGLFFCAQGSVADHPPKEILLGPGESTYILTEFEKYKVTCTGSPGVKIIKVACGCVKGPLAYDPYEVSMKVFYSNGALETVILASAPNLEQCQKALVEAKKFECKA